MIGIAFGKEVPYVVLYDEASVRQLDVSSANSVYQTANVSPTILLIFHREPKAGDEALIRMWVSTLQENDILQRAIDYTTINGELLD